MGEPFKRLSRPTAAAPFSKRDGATYALRYKDEYGRQRQYRIAHTADIKKEAIRVKGRVSVGRNPVEERKANRTIPTVTELSVRYLDYAKTYKRSHDIDERYLKLHLPRFGKLHLDRLDQTAIMEWLQSKVKEGYAQASTRTSEQYAHLDAGVLLEAVNAAAGVTGTTWAADQR